MIRIDSRSPKPEPAIALTAANIAIIDNSQLFREGLAGLCRTMGFSIVLEEDTCQKLRLRSDLLAEANLCLIGLPANDNPGNAMSILQEVDSLKHAAPASRIILLADALPTDQIMSAIPASTDGILLKSISSEILRENLKLALLGEKVFSSGLMNAFTKQATSGRPQWQAKSDAGSILSAREIDILRHLMEGRSNKVIANRLEITEATVKVHLKSILRKTRLTNRTQAAIWAMNKGVPAFKLAQ